jgi:hypothetical protein
MSYIAAAVADLRADQERQDQQRRERAAQERAQEREQYYRRYNEEQIRKQEQEVQQRRKRSLEQERDDQQRRQQQAGQQKREDSPLRQSAGQTTARATAQSKAATKAERERGKPLLMVFERFGIKMGVSTLDDVRRMIKTVGATTIRESNLNPNSKSLGGGVVATNGAAGYGIKDVQKVIFNFDHQLKVSAIIIQRKTSAPNGNLFKERFAELKTGRDIIRQSDTFATLRGAEFVVQLSGNGSNQLTEWYWIRSVPTR